MDGEIKIIDLDIWLARFVEKHNSEGKEEFTEWLNV